MRLIDADMLKKYMMNTGKDVERFLGYIDEQPTTYNLDKVVEQLEDYLFEKYCVEGDPEIERIVKGGGVDGKINKMD